MPNLTFHLIPNAHLDPVWMWQWPEGLNEGIITVRTILDMMGEQKDLTFIRGEAAIYEHIERHDSPTFKRIVKMIKSGRWDVVGGTYIQPDTNLPATETLVRQFERGQEYFTSRFGKPVRVAWAADSFGHSAGLPAIMNAAGISAFAFTRPDWRQVKLAKPAFWWVGPGNSRVMGYRSVAWYGCERDEMPRLLDYNLQQAQKHDLENVAVFFGMGNHGGGPTRRHLADIRQWAAAHPDVRVIFSGLHRLFEDLEEEVKRKGDELLPTHEGELNYCLRGCYSSVARFKFAYRKAEAAVGRAETTDAIIRAATGTSNQAARAGATGGLSASAVATGAELPPGSGLLAEAWDAILFNSFHDILPGSSIEAAYDDQIAWLGGAVHQAQRVELAAMNALAARIDTRVKKAPADHPSGVCAVYFNPYPRPFDGHVELEASLDYRPIWPYRNKADQVPIRVLNCSGKPVPFQEIATAHSAMPDLPWRKRVVMPISIPACGWTVVEMAWVEGAGKPPLPDRPATATPLPSPGTPGEGQGEGPPGATMAVGATGGLSASAGAAIDNGIYRVEARVGGNGVRILREGKPVFTGDGLSAAVFDDPWGCWGGMDEDPTATDISTVREQWTITDVYTLETGPQRATLWVRLAGAKSRIDLRFSVCAGRDAVDVAARVMWDERSARLKLIMPGGDRADFDVPGATVSRGPAGEVPGGRWVRIHGPRGMFGFASDGLYNFDLKDGAFRATVVRATRYTNDVKTPPEAEPWRPAVDAGELRFNFLLSPGDEDLPKLARELERPPIQVFAPNHEGKLPRRGSLAALSPDSLELLALKSAPDRRSLILRVRETLGKPAKGRLTLRGKKIDLGRVASNAIVTWHLTPARGAWRVKNAGPGSL